MEHRSNSDREAVVAAIKEAEAEALKKYREVDQRMPVKKAKGKHVSGRSGKTYSRAVVGRSTSELFRMGYTNAEIADMKRKGSSKTNRSWLINFVIIILAAYIAMSAYNGIQENEAETIVNAYSQKALGYDALIDKGIIEHVWLSFINPEFNLTALSRGIETRVSYAAYEGLGVWNLTDFEPEKAYNFANVEVDNYIYHSYSDEAGIEPLTLDQYHKEIYSSLVNFRFDTDFLLSMDLGLSMGDTYKLTINMQYRNNRNEIHTSEDMVTPVIVGEPSGGNITVIEPDCFITVDDIVGFNFK